MFMFSFFKMEHKVKILSEIEPPLPVVSIATSNTKCVSETATPFIKILWWFCIITIIILKVPKNKTFLVWNYQKFPIWSFLSISLEVLAYPRFCSSSLSTPAGPTSSSKGERAAASEVEIANTTRDQMLRARCGNLTITMPKKEYFVRLVYFAYILEGWNSKYRARD